MIFFPQDPWNARFPHGEKRHPDFMRRSDGYGMLSIYMLYWVRKVSLFTSVGLFRVLFSNTVQNVILEPCNIRNGRTTPQRAPLPGLSSGLKKGNF